MHELYSDICKAAQTPTGISLITLLVLIVAPLCVLWIQDRWLWLGVEFYCLLGWLCGDHDETD